jgi:hypothetical protein
MTSMPYLQMQGRSEMLVASPCLLTIQPDNVPEPAATAPYAPTEAPKKMPTTTPMMNFAMLSAPDQTDWIIAQERGVWSFHQSCQINSKGSHPSTTGLKPTLVGRRALLILPAGESELNEAGA